MTTPEQLQAILERIANQQHTTADLSVLQQLLRQEGTVLQWVSQDGKFNTNVGEIRGGEVHIGDRIYVSWNQEAIQALLQAIRAEQAKEKQENYLHSEDYCNDRQTLEQYLKTTLAKLKQKGCLDLRQNVTQGSIRFNYIAKIKDFEPGSGMRGEAFFLFSEFTNLQMLTLQQFSAQSMVWARKAVSSDAVGQALFNFRMPTHFCFAIALVDRLDPETKTAIQTTNPFDHRVDVLWYEIPVVYELSQQKLNFYTNPTNFWETFKGEIVWWQLRRLIQQLLGGNHSL